MNGDALTKRYEVRDAETGEVVEDAYVLRPKGDGFAWTVMHAYLHLCGVPDPWVTAMAHDPDLLSMPDRDEILARGTPAKSSESQDREGFARNATIGFGDGSMERALVLMRYLGFELVSAVFAEISDEEADKAKGRLEELDEAEYERSHAIKPYAARPVSLLPIRDET